MGIIVIKYNDNIWECITWASFSYIKNRKNIIFHVRLTKLRNQRNQKSLMQKEIILCLIKFIQKEKTQMMKIKSFKISELHSSLIKYNLIYNILILNHFRSYFTSKFLTYSYNLSEVMSIQGLQISKNQIRYVFPKDIKSISQFVKISQLKKKLKEAFQQFANILPNYPFRTRYPNSASSIILQCSFCPNQLVYEVNRVKGIYELKRFSVDHIHGINFDNHQIKRSEPVQSYTLKTQNIEEIIREKTENLCQPLALHFDNKPKPKLKQPNNFEELINIMKAQNYFVYYQPQNFRQRFLIYPDLMIIISEQMRRTYLSSARSIGFDFTFSLIKQTPLTLEGKRQYMIGLIAGLNSNRRIAIYALVVANEESGYFVQRAFTQFIKYMGKQPESIVTDQSLGMLAGMKRIKQKGVYKGHSFWDTFHVLKTYKFRNKQLKTHMRKMIRVKCKYQFHRMYLQAVRLARTEDEMDAIHKFMHQSHKYCISQIPSIFIGLGVSDSQNQMVNNLIKIQIPHQSKYIKVVYRILLFIEQRNLMTQMLARQSCKIDQVVNSRELHIVRYSLCAKVYSFMFTQICKCSKVDIIYEDPDTHDFYCIQDINTVHYVKKLPIQEVDYLIRNIKTTHIKDGFQCSCQFQQKTGIPCQHILKIIFQTDHNFIDRIDQYWVVQQPDKLFKCISNMGPLNDKRVKKKGRPYGRPTMFFNPQQKSQSQIIMPKGISTFQALKLSKREAFNMRNQEQEQFQLSSMKIPQQEDEKLKIKYHAENNGNNKTNNSKRKKMMADFFAGRN